MFILSKIYKQNKYNRRLIYENLSFPERYETAWDFWVMYDKG